MNNILKWIAAHVFAVGLTFLLAVNAVILGGVWFNRNGPPDSTLRLSERELHKSGWQGSNTENSGVLLRIDWRTLSAEAPLESGRSYAWDGGFHGTPEWLNDKKMRELGFEPSKLSVEDARTSKAKDASKLVFLVLEVNGAAYQEALARSTKQSKTALKGGEKLLADERLINSRLFVVDAGLDRESLRVKYAALAGYAIVRGKVATCLRCERGMNRLSGSIRDLDIDYVNVSAAMQPVVAGHVANRYDTPSNAGEKPIRYEVELAFGKRLEPWIVSTTQQ